MRKIDVDDEVFEYLKRKSIWKDQSPNDTLIRLLGIKKKQVLKTIANGTQVFRPQKSPAVNLQMLVDIAMLQEGQELIFKYKRKLSKRYVANVVNGALLWNGETYSMSKLVAQILKTEGDDIPSGAYRGPVYWYNNKGRSVKDLWKQYLMTEK